MPNTTKRAYAHNRISDKLIAQMLKNNDDITAAARVFAKSVHISTPYYKTFKGAYCVDLDKFPMCHPVLDDGTPTRYLTILYNIEKSGTSWKDALMKAGKNGYDEPGMLCAVRYAFIRYGLIKEHHRVGHRKYWSITKLGTSYLAEATRLLKRCTKTKR